MPIYKRMRGTDWLSCDDGSFSPPHYVNYLSWIAAGNTPLPVDPITVAELAAIALAAEDSTAKTVAKADTVIQNLVAIQTLAQCNTFCTNNFPTLTAPERTVLSKIIFALCVLAKQSLR